MPLFPYDEIRNEQKKLVEDIALSLTEKKHILAHAPTGLGKTVASLVPSIEYAMKNNKTVFFLTPKHTQHRIAISTIAQIKEKHKVDINVIDIIGKRWMCIVPGIATLHSRDFAEYCNAMKKEEKCIFYNNVKEGHDLKKTTENMVKELKRSGPHHVEEFCEKCKEKNLCPYEMACELGKTADVIIADYHHFFHPHIRNALLKKIGKKIEDCIVVVDEAQNLPSRVRDILSSATSNFAVRKAKKEAVKYEYEEIIPAIDAIDSAIAALARKVNFEVPEIKVSKDEFIKIIESAGFNYEELIGEMTSIGDEVRILNRASYIGALAKFLEEWTQEGTEYLRYIKLEKFKNQIMHVLHIRCLYPGNSSKEIFDTCHSAILMSGTLMPLQMYRDLLGISPERANLKAYTNPFPKENRLTLIIPDTTTQYKRRSEEEFKKIAKWVAESSNSIKGNVAVFFPSYLMKDNISKYFEKLSRKTIFTEVPEMSKSDREDLINQFKEFADSGAVLLGVIGGSFGEGIDLPGKFLNGAIIVGVPLKTPDLETKSLIDYYDLLFSAGWDYAYINPAINQVIQAAGRTIRTATDRGVVVLIDERFTWNNYFRMLPPDWNTIVTLEPVKRIHNFFNPIQ